MMPDGVPGQQLAIHPRLAEIALQRGQGRQLEQVVHALGGLGQQRHVRVGACARDIVILLRRTAPPHRLLVTAVLGRDVGLGADDWFDACRLRLGPEVVGAIDVAMIGDRDGRHAGPLTLAEHLLQASGTVEHRVLGVYVQVHK